MEHNTEILVVEDEKIIGNFLSAILKSDGYRPLVATSGQEALSMVLSRRPELLLLDLGLPDIDGLDVLHELRQWSDLPVIVVSARQNEEEKVKALDAGANDYITKPFGNAELLARIRTALRHHEMVKSQGDALSQTFSVGNLSIDFAKRRIVLGEEIVHLTPIEYKIVTLLARHAGKVLTHDHIIREVWGPEAGDSQILRVNMANIRRKLEANPADPTVLQTEVGVGYRMADSV